MATQAHVATAPLTDGAAARLAALTRGGRAPERVLEEALDLMPLPPIELEAVARRARIEAILNQLATREPPIPTMAEFDAREYDASGNCQ